MKILVFMSYTQNIFDDVIVFLPWETLKSLLYLFTESRRFVISNVWIAEMHSTSKFSCLWRFTVYRMCTYIYILFLFGFVGTASPHDGNYNELFAVLCVIFRTTCNKQRLLFNAFENVHLKELSMVNNRQVTVWSSQCQNANSGKNCISSIYWFVRSFVCYVDCCCCFNDWMFFFRLNSWNKTTMVHFIAEKPD